MNCRQIATYLNDEGVTSWTGKRFYPELVFGVLRKARLKSERIADAVLAVQCELVSSSQSTYDINNINLFSQI